MRITKKYIAIGIAISILAGISCFAFCGCQSEDASDKAEDTATRVEETTSEVKKTDEIDASEEITTSEESVKIETTKNDSKKEESTKANNSNKETTKTSDKSTPEKHTHSWTAVYKEVDNGEYEITTTKTPWAQCNRCGADITSNPNGHLKMHLENGETEKVSWSTKYRYEETKTWISKIEKVVDYYKCSCGATK